MKLTLDHINDPEEAKHDVRIFRDKTTDQFTKVIFRNKDRMFRFLDYTYHTIYSYLRTRINRELVKQSVHPLAHDENIYLIFKGGNVMHLFYHYYMQNVSSLPVLNSEQMMQWYAQFNDEIVNQGLGENQSRMINDLVKTQMQWNYDIETYALTADENTMQAFLTKLSTKFGISDVDYTLIIDIPNHKRRALIKDIVQSLSWNILNYVTGVFDTHLENQLVNKNVKPLTKPEPYLESTHADDDMTIIQPMSELVHYLKNRAHQTQLPLSEAMMNKFVMYLDHLQQVTQIKHFTKSMAILYLSFDMISYVEYFDRSKVQLMNHTYNLSAIRTHILLNISILISSKEYDLFSLPYYTSADWMEIKTNLAKMYNTLAKNASEREEKHDDENVWILKNPESIQPNDFVLVKRSCLNIEYKIEEHDIVHDVIPCQKYHYISYNGIIRFISPRTIVDFDLLRSKLNVVLKGNHFVKDGKDMNEMNVPSEFIDISIPNEDDAGFLEYVHHLHDMNTGPSMMPLTLSNGNILRVAAYDMPEIVHDLSRTLYSSTNVEIWLDTKYRKRVFRYIYFALLNRTLICKQTLYLKPLNDYFNFIRYCVACRQHFSNAQNTNWMTALEPLLFESHTVTKAQTMTTLNYYTQRLNVQDPATVQPFLNQTLYDMISDDYEDIRPLIMTLYFWIHAIHQSSEWIEIVMNQSREYGGYVKIDATSLQNIKQNVIQFVDVLINTSIKLYFVMHTMLAHENLPEMMH